MSSEVAQRSQSLRRAGLTILKDTLRDPDKPGRETSPFCFAPSPFQVPQLPETIQAENGAASRPAGERREGVSSGPGLFPVLHPWYLSAEGHMPPARKVHLTCQVYHL